MVEEMSKATAGTLKNLTRSTGFKGVHGTTALKNAYRQYLDKALIKMATGTFSYDQCVNDCVKELAQSGLRSIDYTSGRTYGCTNGDTDRKQSACRSDRHALH